MACKSELAHKIYSIALCNNKQLNNSTRVLLVLIGIPADTASKQIARCNLLIRLARIDEGNRGKSTYAHLADQLVASACDGPVVQRVMFLRTDCE